MERAAGEVEIEEVAAGTSEQAHGARDIAAEELDPVRLGSAVGAGRDRPDAGADEVGDEESAAVALRVGGAAVEGEAGERLRSTPQPSPSTTGSSRANATSGGATEPLS